MDGSDEKGGYLTGEEVSQAIVGLSAADKQRALEIAASYCAGSEFDPNELLHEAVIRLLQGSRRAPREHPFIAVLINAMKSIKSAWYQSKWHTCTEGLEVDDVLGTVVAKGGADEAVLYAAARQAVDVLLDALDGYPLEQDIALMRAEEISPEQIREELNLTKTQYSSALKQIKRLALKNFPEGWHP